MRQDLSSAPTPYRRNGAGCRRQPETDQYRLMHSVPTYCRVASSEFSELKSHRTTKVDSIGSNMSGLRRQLNSLRGG